MSAACAEVQKNGVARKPRVVASNKPRRMGFGDMTRAPLEGATCLNGKRTRGKVSQCICKASNLPFWEHSGLSKKGTIEFFYGPFRKVALTVPGEGDEAESSAPSEEARTDRVCRHEEMLGEA